MACPYAPYRRRRSGCNFPVCPLPRRPHGSSSFTTAASRSGSTSSIARSCTNGELARRIRDDALTGMTSNPDDLREGAGRGDGVRRSDPVARRRLHGDGAVRAHRDGRRARRVRHLPAASTTPTQRRRRLRVDRGVARRGARRRARRSTRRAPLGDGRPAERDGQGAGHRRGREGRAPADRRPASTSTSRCCSRSRRTRA